MARNRSSQSTTTWNLGDSGPMTPETPSTTDTDSERLEPEYPDLSKHDKPVDDSPLSSKVGEPGPSEHSPAIEVRSIRAEAVRTVETSPSPSGRKARKRTTIQTTKIKSDTVLQFSGVVRQELTLMDEDPQDEHHPPAQDQLPQMHAERSTEIPTRAKNDESSSRQSTADPETPRQTPKDRRRKRYPLPPRDTWKTIEKMSNVLKQGLDEYEKRGLGHAYLLEDTSSMAISPFKIGSAQQDGVEIRVRDHVNKCGLKGPWKPKSFPQRPIRGYRRLEFVTHEQLYYIRHRYDCQCKTDHREWFLGEKEKAREILEFWAQWLKSCEPYDSDGKLLPFWASRLGSFELGWKKHFRCLDYSCKRDCDGPITCQECLRVGWKAWTEPTQWDYFWHDMRSPPSFPSIYFHLIFFLTVTSLFMSSIPVSGIAFLAKFLKIFESIAVGLIYFWIHGRSILSRLETLIETQKQKVQAKQATTPKKQSQSQSPDAETPMSAPPRLENGFMNTGESESTPTQFSPPGHFPETEPVPTWSTSERCSIADESPSRAAQRRRRANNPSMRPSTRGQRKISKESSAHN